MWGLGGRIRQFLDEQCLPNLRLLWTSRQPVAWALAVVIGVAVAYAIIAFRLGIAVVQIPWIGTMSEKVASAAAAQPWWVVFLAPVVGGLVVGLMIQHLMPTRRAEAVADVIEARVTGGARIPWRRGLVNAVVTSISLGSGASAGREGPAVHIGAAVASVLADLVRLPGPTRRALFGCGVAAAVSASFNAPIAGALFALEVILGHYAMSAFVPIVIASVGATVITRLHLGDFPAFTVPDYQITSYLEFPAFALLGLTCGLVAVCFLFSVIAADWVARRIDVPLWSRPVIGGVLVGAIGVAFPQVLGVGYETTDQALRHQLPLVMLLVLLVAKTAATAITMASRFGGGVFSPALYLGAMTGGAFGIIAASVFPQMASSEGLYAIIGMGAVTAAILGAPISTTLIVFELTGGYEVTIALLLAVSMAVAVMQAIHGRSLFHWQLGLRGLFLTEGPQRQLGRQLTVRAFMTPLAEDEAPEPDDGAPMLTPDDSLESALRSFNAAGRSRLAVVDAGDAQRVVGWADHVRALDAFNAALIAANVEEHR